MRRVLRLRATDGEVSLNIKGEVVARPGRLSRGEMDAVLRSLAREIADSLKWVPYTDFGIDNTEVSA